MSSTQQTDVLASEGELTEFKSPLAAPEAESQLMEILGVELITHDKRRLRGHAEAVAQNLKMKQPLIELVLRTRDRRPNSTEDEKLIVAASNAISILNYGSVHRLLPFRFDEVGDWSGIRVPLANLNHARIISCNFNGSDLSHSTMIQAVLRGSTFCGANLKNVETGVRVPLPDQIERVIGANFSPDGRFLACSSLTRSVRLWDMETGHCTETLRCSALIWCVAFSPNSKTVASGAADGIVRIWDIDSEECITTLYDGPWLNVFSSTPEVRIVAFSPDGCLLASGYSDGIVRIWDLELRQCRAVMKGHAKGALAIHFTPDGSRVISSSSDHTIRVWSVGSGECISDATMDNARASSIQLSPDGSLIASISGPGSIQLWSVEPLRPIRTLGTQVMHTDAFAFSPDGKLLASGDSHWLIRFWDVDSGQCISTLRGHVAMVCWLGFSPDGRKLASFSGDTDIRLWPVLPFTQYEMISDAHDADVTAVRFMSDGKRLVSGSTDRTIRLWDLETKQCVSVLKGHENGVISVALSSDNRKTVSLSADSTIRIWNISSGECTATFGGDSRDCVRSLALSPDGRLLASAANVIQIWDAETCEPITVLGGHTASVSCLCFSPDGKMLASASNDTTARLWDVKDETCIATLKGHEYDVISVSFSPDGKLLATGSCGDNVRLWSVEAKQCIAALECPGRSDEPVAFSPESSESDSSKNGAESVLALSFSPDSQWLVAGSGDGSLTVWRVESTKYVSTFQAHSGRITSISFSSDGRWLATGSADSTVRIWRVSMPYMQLYECFGSEFLDLTHIDFNGAQLTGPLEQWVQWYDPGADEAAKANNDIKLYGETVHLDSDIGDEGGRSNGCTIV